MPQLGNASELTYIIVIVAAACALVTHRLGVDRLVGAIVYGIVAQQDRHYPPPKEEGVAAGA